MCKLPAGERKKIQLGCQEEINMKKEKEQGNMNGYIKRERDERGHNIAEK